MGLHWQTKKLRHRVSQGFTFPVSNGDTLVDFVAGISAFHLAYSSSSHRVQDLGITLDTRQSGNTVFVTPRIAFTDSSGHSADRSSSWVYVTVLAWVGSGPDSAPYLDTTRDLSHTAPDLVAPDALSSSGCLLSSFNLRHAAGPQNVSSVSARVQARLHSNGQHLTALGSADLTDDSGNTAGLRSLQAGILAPYVSSDDFRIRIASVSTGPTNFGQANNTTTASFDFDQGVSSATALLVSFGLAFGDGSPSRRISSITAGALTHTSNGYSGPSESLHIQGNQVTVTTNVSMVDHASHPHQSALNQATFLIIASPA